MFRQVRTILEMIKFSHTLFALPFALLAAGMATRSELREAHAWRPLDWVGILLCMVFARSTAMAFNRLADRKLDAENPRTAMRHLPTGVLKPAAVGAFVVACAGGFVASTTLFWLSSENLLPLYLSGPVLAFICLYSLTKRFTALSHFWLGAALLLAPVSTWIAIRGRVEWPPVVLGAAVLFWVAGFDMLYACQDVDFDRVVNLHSIPTKLGVPGALRLAMICHFLMVGALAAFYFVAAPMLGMIYLSGVAAVAGLLVYEHALVRPENLTRVNQAFFHVNAVISVGLLVVVLLQVVLTR